MRRPRGRPPRRLEVLASAKVNLGWEVGPKMPDGYHAVRGLLQTISLRDRLSIGVLDDGYGTSLEVDGPEALPGLDGPDNLVLRAADRLAERTDPFPTRLRLYKDIPVAAGLGGGSADAAAALLGLSLAWGSGLTAGDLLEIAGEIGSDVPAILLGGLVHATGRGEQVVPVGSAAGLALVAGFPDAALGAGEVYARLDELRAEGLDPRPPGFGVNDLEPAAASLEPAVADGLAAMRRAGAPVVFVSGSGPAVIGLCPVPERAPEVASAVAPVFRRVEVCEPSPWGVRAVLRGSP